MRRNQSAPAAVLVAVFICSTGVGCSAFRGPKADDLASIDDVRGPTERALQTVAYEQQVAAQADDPALVGARSIYDSGRYAEAEKAYKTILKKYRPDALQKTFGRGGALGRGPTADERAIEEYGSPIEQECLFMIGECQFARRDFPAAEESYQRLMVRYPSTRHLDTVTKRIYSISRHWLGFPPAKISGGPGYDENSGDIQQVVFTDVQQSVDPAVAPTKTGWLNVVDKTKPTFDTTGRAIQSLKSIWLNDPTGPLADDALILTANHYYRNGDPVEAARYYELLREQYPDSPHLKNAYLLESHVKFVSYAGHTYDETHLEEAQKLKQASLQIFPDLSDDQKSRIRRELAQIEDASIAREWELVELYRQKGRIPAVQLHCNAIIHEHPDSQYAERARRLLQQVAAEKRSGKKSLWPFRGRTAPIASPAVEPVATAAVDLGILEPPTQTAASPQSPNRGLDLTPAQTTTEVASPPGTSGSPLQQISETVDPDANPFAEIMNAVATDAEKAVIDNANYEEPAGDAAAGLWKRSAGLAGQFEQPRR